MGRFEVRIQGGFWVLMALWLLLIPLKWVAGTVFAAAVHEGGHLLAILLTGGRVRALELGPGGARIETDPMEPRQELVCALAGPAAGAATVLLWRWFPQAAIAGMVQTVFNLIPVYPMDGGRVVRIVLGRET